MVATNPKQRFEFDAAGERIRARQGHSVAVELGYAPSEPPELLYHGTVASALPAIRRDGLLRMQRHAVHLSADVATAERVGGRRGEALILVVHARRLAATGVPFARTDNGVWLVERVPPEFVVFPGGA